MIENILLYYPRNGNHLVRFIIELLSSPEIDLKAIRSESIFTEVLNNLSKLFSVLIYKINYILNL